jgi:7-cyano-7-deazaguanine synthase in queuosine biosynthesis
LAPGRDNNLYNVLFKDLATVRNGTHWFLKPFFPITKDWIIKQYRNNNYTDLLKLTRSCEAEFEDLDYKTYSEGQEITECGECYWCIERQWAIDKVYGDQNEF